MAEKTVKELVADITVKEGGKQVDHNNYLAPLSILAKAMMTLNDAFAGDDLYVDVSNFGLNQFSVSIYRVKTRLVEDEPETPVEES